LLRGLFEGPGGRICARLEEPTVPTTQPSPADDLQQQQRRASLALAVALGLAASLLAASALLWAHYGTTVFFEMIKAGIAACF
jgi:hypothetical protein